MEAREVAVPANRRQTGNSFSGSVLCSRMERGFLYPAGELNGRPLHETFFLSGRPIRPHAIPAVIAALDRYLRSREPERPQRAWEDLGLEEEREDTKPHERVWEATDVPALLDAIDPRFLDGAKRERVGASIPRTRLGFLAEENAPFAVLLGKADINPSTLSEGQNLDIDLQRLSGTLRFVVDSILTDAGIDRSSPGDLFDPFVQRRPFSIFHGLVAFEQEELQRLRDICDTLRRGEAGSLKEEGELRRELRDTVGFRPMRSSTNHASHVIFGGNIHYQVEPAENLIEHPNHALATLRLQWASSTGATDQTRADPSGALPHPPRRESDAASTGGLLGLVVTRTWFQQLVEEAWDVLRDVDELRAELERDPPEGLAALDRINKLGYAASRTRRNLSWAMYHDLRGLEELSSETERGALEYGIPPPWWNEERPWEGQDNRFVRHLASTTLDLLNHLRELTTETTEQIGFLAQQTQGRVSIRYAAAMEGHNRWTKWLTIVIAILSVVLVFLSGALL